ncbi:MAG: DUF3343 domain-containing protein [Moorellales bacterium]
MTGMAAERVTYFTFPSTYWALKAEKAARQAGLRARLVPVPRQLSSLCGLALELATEQERPALEALRGVKVERMVRVIMQAGLITQILQTTELGG